MNCSPRLKQTQVQLSQCFLSRFTRISPERFDHLLSLVEEKIKRKTHIREPTSPAERLAITLRYLASGDRQQSIAFLFKIGHSTANKMVNEVCDALWDALQDYISQPSSESDWKNIVSGFEDYWNMPYCLGAIDGKHIAMKTPAHSGSLRHNYKGYFSTVLLAICDAHYNFTAIDIWEHGSSNDCGVVLNSRMGRRFEQNRFNIRPPETLDGFDEKVPFFLVDEEIFPLKEWLMCPFAGKQLTDEMRKVFNYKALKSSKNNGEHFWNFSSKVENT